MGSNLAAVNKVGTNLIISSEQDWTQRMSKRITEKNQNILFDEYDLNDVEKDIVKELKKKISEGIYFTFDTFTLAITRRYVLDNKIVASSRKDAIEEVTSHNYRGNNSKQIQKKTEKYHSSLMDPYLGIFKGHYRAISDSMPLIAFGGQLGTRYYDAYGRAKTYRDAYLTGLLEGLERYHGLGSSEIETLIKSEMELQNEKSAFVPFSAFCHYNDYNYNQKYFYFPKYTKFSKISWIESYSVSEQFKVLIPEQVVYYSCEQLFNKRQEERYISETSNGTALGSNWYEASIAAMLELIERDSFLVYWYTKSSPLKITNVEKIEDEEVQMILGYLNYSEYKTHIFDISLETGVPTFWVLLEYLGEDESTLSFYTAAGSNFNSIKAIKAALIEASTSVKVFKEYMSSKYTSSELYLLREYYSEVKKLEDHLYLFSDKSMRKHLEFALDTSNEITFEQFLNKQRSKLCFNKGTQKSLFYFLINRINSITQDIYITGLTTKFLENMKLACVKAHIPDFQNIGFGMQYQNVNIRRLSQAIDNNSLNGNLSRILTCPHPFP